jgi:hypothetical protein
LTEVDTSLVGKLAVEMMDDIQEQYGPDAEIVDALLIVEVDSGDYTSTQWRCTTERATVGVGMAKLALNGLESGFYPSADEEEDDD